MRARAVSQDDDRCARHGATAKHYRMRDESQENEIKGTIASTLIKGSHYSLHLLLTPSFASQSAPRSFDEFATGLWINVPFYELFPVERQSTDVEDFRRSAPPVHVTRTKAFIC
jgi:hypothetical protein